MFFMAKHIESNIEETTYHRIWSVADFARRYRLGKEEEIKLIALFGPFAGEHELLMNARRSTVFR